MRAENVLRCVRAGRLSSALNDKKYAKSRNHCIVYNPLLNIGIPLIVKYQAYGNPIQHNADKQRKII